MIIIIIYSIAIYIIYFIINVITGQLFAINGKRAKLYPMCRRRKTAV